jgi:NAD(P)-dependent dehydrogenase (short-subunit alcohol dehydrogenase family)
MRNAASVSVLLVILLWTSLVQAQGERSYPNRPVTSSGATVEQIERNFSANVSIGRIVDATEVADVVAFLASPRSVAINGDVVACGGGHRGAIHY